MSVAGGEGRTVKIASHLEEGRFLERMNRFAALVRLGGAEVVAHVPNSGRMGELLRRGATVLVARRGPGRATCCDLVMVQEGTRLVSLDARLPPGLVAEAMLEGRLPELGRFDRVRREVRVGQSRLDLAAEGDSGTIFVETKSVTLVRDGLALFPDAPTSRGARHLLELRRLAEDGHGAAVVFVVQRGDGERFRPNVEADSTFAALLREVAGAVLVLAYGCRVTRGEVAIDRRVPVEL